MKTIIKTIFVMMLCVFITSCTKPKQTEFVINYYDGDTLVNTESSGLPIISTYTLEDDVTKKFIGWKTEDGTMYEEKEIVDNTNLYAVWEEIELFTVKYKDTIKYKERLIVNVAKNIKTATLSLKYEVDNDIAYIASSSNINCIIETYGVGEFNLTITDKSGYSTTCKIKVVGEVHNISYDLDEELLEGLPTTYDTNNLPFNLPVVEKEGAIFGGWMVDNARCDEQAITYENGISGDIKLTPIFTYPYLDVSFEEGDALMRVNETISLNVSAFKFPQSLLQDGFNVSSSNDDICGVNSQNVILNEGEFEKLNVSLLAKKLGYVEIKIELKANTKFNLTIGVTVDNIEHDFEEIFEFFARINQTQVIAKNINVVGWQKQYRHDLIGSISGVLFDELEIIENIAPLANGNRPGTKKEKYYICVHDTGDASYTAKQWSDTVKLEKDVVTGNAYSASFQYVIGNDGCYHNIPDDEVAYHAGDGTRNSYKLIPSGVMGNNKYPEITITADGYYAIDGTKSSILAPTNNGQILQTKDINDCGIRSVIIDGEYHLGDTWYNSDYRKISNRGGNNNSIGIESCINEGSDIFLTWQMLAKLVAKLMDENSLTIDDIVPHHYFSGKNCPQTMRGAGMWDYFKDLVLNEYQLRMFEKNGFKVTMSTDAPNVDFNGRVKSLNTKATIVKYTITVEKDGVSKSMDFAATIPYSTLLLNR